MVVVKCAIAKYVVFVFDYVSIWLVLRKDYAFKIL